MLRHWLASFCICLSASSLATDSLTIISPHRKSIQNEFIPKFKAHYKSNYGNDIRVDWLDQGGTENDLRFVLSKFEKNPNTSNIDIFWGGGEMTFMDLEERGLLLPLTISQDLQKQLPDYAAGIPLRGKGDTWRASAMSSFGIFYNKKLIKILGLPTPHTWVDLAKPEYLNHVVVADPRHSSTSLFMYLVMLEAMGWEKGWELLFSLAGNSRLFTHSSSDPIKAIVSGEAAVATSVDFYAKAKILDLGTQNLGYALPAGQTVLNSDPIAILKGAPNKLEAQRFAKFVLSKEGQKLFALRKGEPGGPKFVTLGRMSVNKSIYESLPKDDFGALNPFALPTQNLKVSSEKFADRKAVISDLLGALHIDTHHELKGAWVHAVKSGQAVKHLSHLAAPPISEKDLKVLASKWGINDFETKQSMIG